LRGDHPQLRVGDVLVFEEVLSPTRHTHADADRSRRWAVRLTAVEAAVDPSGRLFDEVPVDAGLADHRDRLGRRRRVAVPVCVGVQERPDLVISEVLGNIVLADHGQTVFEEPLGTVPEPT
jgi:hypothetical protein